MIRRACLAAIHCIAVIAAMQPLVAGAACLQELAVYVEPEAQASLEFTPADAGAMPTHTFKVKFPENSVILDGIVLTTEGVVRSHGQLMHKCPVGDVTGEELAACTIWQGVIYGVDIEGRIGLLPSQGQPAAAQILLPDFAAFVRQSSIYGTAGVSKLPWDVFALSGCQE